MPHKPSRFMRSQEIAALLSPAGRRKYHYDVSVGKIQGAVRNPSGWGHTVSRVGFMAWLQANPQCRVEQSDIPSAAKKSQSAIEIPQHNSLRDENSPKEKSDERSSIGACPA